MEKIVATLDAIYYNYNLFAFFGAVAPLHSDNLDCFASLRFRHVFMRAYVCQCEGVTRMFGEYDKDQVDFTASTKKNGL